MERREFLRLASLPLLPVAPAHAAGSALGSEWRTFELTYAVDLGRHDGPARLWLPIPSRVDDFQHVLHVDWQGGARQAVLTQEDRYAAPMLCAQWQGKEQDRSLSVMMRVATRDRQREKPQQMPRMNSAVEFYLQPTPSMPTDGIVAETSRSIVHGIKHPDDKAQAIYEWIVDNTFRAPEVRGCGLGDIKFMLESGNLGGKCADINSLFVGLCRAAGIPAREMYGVRVAESRQFKSMGKAGDIAKAQHCRAEYFSPRFGWVPVDPADVRKVVLEDKIPLSDPRVIELRQRLFGFWEMNWVGFNRARDFDLKPRASVPLPYLMYPYAEVGALRMDGREPKHFDFTMTSREISNG